MQPPLFLGIDIGTSGVRSIVIDNDARELASHAVPLPAPVDVDGRILQDAQLWINAVTECLRATTTMADPGRLAAIAVDGTSSTLVLCRDDGAPLTAAMMYNDASSREQAERIASIAPADCGAHGASSSLAKLLALRDAYPELAARYVCHQGDFIASWLSGSYGISDENNCLKLGYDVIDRRWPEWLLQLDIPAELLPDVVRCGTAIGEVSAQRAQEFGIAADCRIVSGTTDSIAAFIATGSDHVGDAVTSLGSTLVIKMLSDRPVFSPLHGVYSHRYYADDGLWLVGGASSAGCRVLSQLFSQQQIDAMTARLQPQQPTGLDYYPLPVGSRGERFPVADPDKQALLEPRPDDDVVYFQGLLENIADIEADSYRLLDELGAGRAGHILTAGGGSRNPAWNTIRRQKLGCAVNAASHTEACYGAALLARYGYRNSA